MAELKRRPRWTWPGPALLYLGLGLELELDLDLGSVYMQGQDGCHDQNCRRDQLNDLIAALGRWLLSLMAVVGMGLQHS